MYGPHFQQSMIWINRVSSPVLVHIWKKRKGEEKTNFLSSFAPENVISRDRFDDPVPRQPAYHSPHSRLNVVLTYGFLSIQYYCKLPLLQQNRMFAYGKIVQFISMAS